MATAYSVPRQRRQAPHVSPRGRLRRRRVWIVEQLDARRDTFVCLDESRRYAERFVEKMNHSNEGTRTTFALRAGWIVYKSMHGSKGGAR